MRKLKGLFLVTPAVLVIFLELYYLLIRPINSDTLPQLEKEQYWAIAIPVFFLTSVVMLIVAWVGYTMIVTKEPIKKTYDTAYEEAAGELQSS